ncbi:hypothetical protein CL630_03630 [bacterium]|nr:hypothetical protein [bacterium]|tara:strand:+ start:300 stop:581 length:282 start_codon:yes stop_codon:yes gene_type:complete
MYQLKYQKPYKGDEIDSTGCREVLWDTIYRVIKANTDEEAEAAAKTFLKGVVFELADKTYKRHGISLVWSERLKSDETRVLMEIGDFSHGDED